MAKNLSEKVRAICGLRSPGGGHLPPPDRRNGSALIEGREQQRRDRVRELAERMKQKGETKREIARVIAETVGKTSS